MSENETAEVAQNNSQGQPQGANSDSNASQYLTFVLNEQEYAVEILKVQGIQGWGSYTTLPNTPDYILGVVNLRGAIVPIIDLRIRFNMPQAEYNKLTVMIVVKVQHASGEKAVGLVVDAVSEVYNINAADMNPAPNFGDGVDTEYIKGLAMIDEKMMIALDIDKLISESVLAELPDDMAA